MERREDLDPAERRRFQTGRASLDFTHTGGDGPFARWEVIHSPTDAARYLGIVLDCEPPRTTTADMDSLFGLRTAITTVARTIVDDAASTLPAESIEALNAAATDPPLRITLTAGAEQTVVPGNARAACSSLARDAIDLFASPLRDRIRVCDAADCGLLLVDTSRPGRRRWCSMDWCGDRQKKRSAGRPVR
jgi:predicted RNA-binding Zn ribbon-like protein